MGWFSKVEEPSVSYMESKGLFHTQIVHGVTVFMVLGFGVVAAVMRFVEFAGDSVHASPDPDLQFILNVLCMVYIGVLVAHAMLVHYVPRIIIRRKVAKAAKSGLSGDPLRVQALGNFFGRLILRDCMLEGASTFGLIIFMIAPLLDGYSEVYYLTAVPAGLFLVYAVMAFPRREDMDRFADRFIKRVHEQARLLGQADVEEQT